jgi:hypothetical protein
MKQVRLTKDELKWLRWRVWEPLRRNEAYRKEFLDLKATGLTSFETYERFCERWRIPWPISPTIDFDKLQTAPWLADFFSAYFTHHSEPAAFVPCSNFIQGHSRLRVFINPDYSRTQIEVEFYKIYGEWLKKREFYGIRRTPMKPSAAFRRVRRVGDHIEIHLDLSATRRAILAGADKVLDRISRGNRKANELPRLHEEKWRMAFKAYDLANKTPSSIALVIDKKPNTVVRPSWTNSCGVIGLRTSNPSPHPRRLQSPCRWTSPTPRSSRKPSTPTTVASSAVYGKGTHQGIRR